VIWLVVIVGLLLLVFLHELGHFTVALAVGIRPRSFYVGFPPAVAKFRHKGIEYGIGALPLGGYVRIPGMHRPASRDFDAWIRPALQELPALTPAAQRVRRALDAEDLGGARAALPELEGMLEPASLSPVARRSAHRALRELDEGTGRDAYWRQPTWKRIAVIAAGPLVNVLVAFLLFFGGYSIAHSELAGTTRVEAVNKGTPAAAAGLLPGDRVVAVNGHRTPTFDEISHRIQSSDGRPITVTVVRGGHRVVLGPRRTMLSSDGRWIWGFAPATVQRAVSYSAGTSAHLAAQFCWQTVTGTAKAFAGLVHKQGRSELSGPVGIVRVSAQALRTSFADYVRVLGFISMSLALLNLLPFLPLDGGHIVFSLIEAVRRRALAREVYERVSVLGFAFVFLIWVIALSNDVSRGVPH
jgi:regulator of sigma E protease